MVHELSNPDRAAPNQAMRLLETGHYHVEGDLLATSPRSCRTEVRNSGLPNGGYVKEEAWTALRRYVWSVQTSSDGGRILTLSDSAGDQGTLANPCMPPRHQTAMGPDTVDSFTG